MLYSLSHNYPALPLDREINNGNMQINGCDCVPIKLYLQKQTAQPTSQFADSCTSPHILPHIHLFFFAMLCFITTLDLCKDNRFQKTEVQPLLEL